MPIASQTSHCIMSESELNQYSSIPNVPGGPPFSLRVPYPSDGRPTELSIPWPHLQVPIPSDEGAAQTIPEASSAIEVPDLKSAVGIATGGEAPVSSFSLSHLK